MGPRRILPSVPSRRGAGGQERRQSQVHDHDRAEVGVETGRAGDVPVVGAPVPRVRIRVNLSIVVFPRSSSGRVVWRSSNVWR